MKKYKYSRKEIMTQLLYLANNKEDMRIVDGVSDMLLAKSTKHKSTGKKCEHSWLQDAPIKVCYKCGFRAVGKKDSLVNGLGIINKELEVIGNIYENPDLLPTKEKGEIK